MRFALPLAAVSIITAEVRRWGIEGVEAGGFMLGPAGEPEVSVVAFAGSRGVLRTPVQFTVSSQAIEWLSEWSDSNGLRIRAQFHSHRHGSDLSLIDRTGGLRVAGFVSAVIPHFVDPPGDPTQWGWWQFRAGDWQKAPAPPCRSAQVRSIAFDEGGVVCG